MAHPNASLMKRFFDAIVAGDRPTMAACLADDVVMHVPGKNSVSGTYKGKEQFAAAMAKADEITGGLQRELHDITASDDHVVALVGLKATRDGRTLTWNGANVWHVRDGKLAEVWLVSDDQDTTDVAFA
ncbi:MAG: nuclear transport factor 2 family protein [Actinomycetota bacterium]